MDQLISAGATAGHASLMDCRTLTLTPVSMPAGTVIAVMDSGTRRVLADVRTPIGAPRANGPRPTWASTALRDATLDQLSAVADDTDRRRARHVITENARTLEAADAMRRGDVQRLGRLMSESHRSLRDDFEVSGPGLDAIVDVARAAPGCLGARMTGGGFAGCAVALVRQEDTEAFTRSIVEGYEHGGHTATVWICEPSAGATILDPAAEPRGSESVDSSSDLAEAFGQLLGHDRVEVLLARDLGRGDESLRRRPLATATRSRC